MGAVAAKTIDEAAIMAVLETVPDPEIPVLTITDLGIVRGFADDPPRVLISPTYTGCPATVAIEHAIREALDASRLRRRPYRAGAVPAVDDRLDHRARPRAAARLRDRAAEPVGDRRMPAMRIDRHGRGQPLRLDPVQGAMALQLLPGAVRTLQVPLSALERHHSAKLPSLVRKIGLRQRCRSLSASRTAASSMSTPRPGPSGTGR